MRKKIMVQLRERKKWNSFVVCTRISVCVCVTLNAKKTKTNERRWGQIIVMDGVGVLNGLLWKVEGDAERCDDAFPKLNCLNFFVVFFYRRVSFGL